MENLHKIADGLLADIRTKRAVIESIGAAYAEKIATVTALRDTVLADDQAELAALEKKLVKLMRKNKSDLFPGDKDRVDLTHGSLLYKARDVVKRVRTVTAKLLEKMGFGEAVETVKSVDWDEIEKWPDVKLAEIGTERKPKEAFEWELKESSTGDQGSGK